MKTTNQLCVEAHAYVIEACQLGEEAIKIAFKAHEMALDDTRRWRLSQRMFEINHRLREIKKAIVITEEKTHENRTV